MSRRFAISALVLLASCSLAQPHVDRCTSDAQCETLFGPGSTCGAAGYCDELSACTTNTQCVSSLGFGAICNAGTCENLTPTARCTTALPTDLWSRPDAYRDRVVLGALFDLGDSVHVGRANAVQLAINTINESGGIDGRRFALALCDIHGGANNGYDDLSRTDAAIASATWLADTASITAIVGPSSSTDTERVYLDVIRAREPRVILISPASSSPSLTGIDNAAPTDETPGLLWRTATSSTDQSVAVAHDMATRTPTISRVAILREAGSNGTALVPPFDASWNGTYEEFVFEDGNATARTEQTTLLGTRIAEFDAIYMIGQTADTRAFVAQATENPAFTTDLAIYFSQAGGSNDVFSDAANNRLFTRLRAARPAVARSFEYLAFRDAFLAQYPGMDPDALTNAPHAWDATWLAALGSAWALAHGRLDGQGIARGIRHTVGGTTRVSLLGSNWQTALTGLDADGRIDVTGASGNLDFDLATEETQGLVELVEGQPGGTYVVLP